MLVADFEPFSVEVLKGAADAIRAPGFELVAYSAGGRVDEHVGWERRYLSRVMGTLVDGAVLVTPTVTDVQYDGPIVAVDPHTGPSRLPTVTADNLQGARLGVDHLLGLGHRRIGMVTGRPDLISAQLREQRLPRGPRGGRASPVDESLLALGRLRARAGPRRPRGRCSPCPTRRPRSSRPTTSRPWPTLEVAAELGIDVPGRPLGRRLRQHPRVGAGRPAADHRRAADPPDGPRRHRACSSP